MAHYVIVALLLNIIILKTIETIFSGSISKNLIEQTTEEDSIDEKELDSTDLIYAQRPATDFDITSRFTSISSLSSPKFPILIGLSVEGPPPENSLI